MFGILKCREEAIACNMGFTVTLRKN